MRLSASPDDFLKGKPIDVGFHPAVISAYVEKQSKRRADSSPDWSSSTYAEVQFKITAGPNKGSVVYTNFSEKAATFIVPLLEAITGKEIPKDKPFNGEVSEVALKGKLVDIHVVRGSWNNRPKNEIDGFKPYSGPKEYSFT